MISETGIFSAAVLPPTLEQITWFHGNGFDLSSATGNPSSIVPLSR